MQIIITKLSRLYCSLFCWFGLLLTLLPTASLAGPPADAKAFVCESPVYQIARTNSQLIRISVTGTTAEFVDIGSSAGLKINGGWGYNVIDSLGYAIRSGTQQLYVVDGDGTFTDLGVVAGMGNAQGSNAGDILPDGTMIFKNNQGRIMTLDLTSEPYVISSSFNLTGPAANASYVDMAFNPVDGKMYAIDSRTDRFFYFDIDTGATTYFGNSNLSGTYGAQWFDGDGYFYAYDNGSNKLFIVDAGVLGSGTGDATYIATSPVDEGGTNDGLSCRGPALLPLLDYGDAAPSYGDSPHRVAAIPTVYLGDIKPDVDSSPKNANNGNVNGLGDDNDGGDDEDGVSFPTLVRGQQADISVTVNGASGYLQAWIDWNANGVFESGERIANNVQDSDNDGTIILTVTVPESAQTTQTSARFRWSTDRNLTHTGEASDGEAEDYLVTIYPPVFLTLIKEVSNNDGGNAVAADWTLRAIGSNQTYSGITGDPGITNAVVSTGTYTLSELGPANYLRTSISCTGGTLVGNQLTLNDGNNVSCTFSNNDQAVFPGCSTASYVDIRPSDLGFSDSSSQSNISGTYDVSGLFGLSSGVINLNLNNAAIRSNRFTTSQSQAADWTFSSPNYPLYLRVEHAASLSGDGKLDGFSALDGVFYSPVNAAPDGYFYGAVQAATQLDYHIEAGPTATAQSQPFIWQSQQAASQLRISTTNSDSLENDYAIQAALCQEEDWGDAPTENTGYGHARHAITGNSVYLGSTPPDAETSSLSDIDADGDDSLGNDDEDGIADFPVLLNTSTEYSVEVSCSGVNSTVTAWIDFNNNGIFDASEQNSNHPTICGAGVATLEWSSLIGLVPSLTYVRVRTASNANEVASATGSAIDGEVEDYILSIAKQTMTEPPNGACVAEGGAIGSDNLITQFDGGSFGTENGQPGQSPETDPYLGEVTGSTYAQYQSRSTNNPSGAPLHGQFSYAANVVTARNTSQHEPVVDPEYGMTGRFFAADPDGNPTNLNLTINGLTPYTQYEFSFWAANSERSGNPNEITVSVDGSILYTTGPLVADNAALPWQRHSFTFTNGASGSTNIVLSSVHNEKTGNDYYLDNMTVKDCDFLNDFGDAPASYGIAHHVGPLIPNLRLGASIDEETASQYSTNSDGDDNTGRDDEDGISNLTALQETDRVYRVTSNVTNLSGTAATLIGWIDFDQSGTFDPDEAAIRQIANGTNSANLTLQWSNIPLDSQAGNTHLRLRLTSKGLSNSEPSGEKRDGEVEDYPITINGDMSVSGRVYHDDNSNASYDAGEPGIGNVTVVLLNTDTLACISTQTTGSGEYRFSGLDAGSYQVYEAANETAPIPQHCGVEFASDPANYRSTSPNVRAILTLNAGESIANQHFGDISPVRFEPDHQGQILPGNVIFYAHRFSSALSGELSIIQSNNNTAWASLLYLDNNCDGTLTGNEASVALSNPIAVSADIPVCVINKVFAPANTPAGDQYLQTLTAVFDAGNRLSGKQTLSVRDLTTVRQAAVADNSAGASRLKLIKKVQNLTQGSPETETLNTALPGETLRYRIHYRNTGRGAINDLVINDSVPVMTELSSGSAACVSTPTSLSCNPVVSGSAIQWQFSGTLLGGQQGIVSYQVVIDR